MRLRILAMVFGVLATILICTSCSSLKSSSTAATTPNPAATASLDGATLVEERCSMCHPASVVTLRKHTSAEWKAIVGMMVQRGAQLSPEEETVVVGYLAKTYGQ